eukprot:TRINITY_DN66631_c7_g1_i2.p1 TRINITY_DN66631_c7_g1~~TRINITY_DN66631_c7_g1_i2.p1  ORF type:complete len:121 (+),score=58.43 TRINITY_DN66631_c7_g1_i2:54-416(+)
MGERIDGSGTFGVEEVKEFLLRPLDADFDCHAHLGPMIQPVPQRGADALLYKFPDKHIKEFFNTVLAPHRGRVKIESFTALASKHREDMDKAHKKGGGKKKKKKKSGKGSKKKKKKKSNK